MHVRNKGLDTLCDDLAQFREFREFREKGCRRLTAGVLSWLLAQASRETYRAKEADRLSRRLAPFSAVPSDGLPMIPELV